MLKESTPTQLHPLPVSLIVPSRWQPRTSFDAETLLELAKHIHDHGLMYPVIVFVNEDDEHELVAGERRTRAIAALGLTRCEPWTAEHGTGLREAIRHVAEHGWVELGEEVHRHLVLDGVTIAARIEANGDHRHLHQLAVADNIQRENLSPLEEARAIEGLMEECGFSQREVARQIGWSQSKVQERLSLLDMAEETREALTARAIGPSHARHLAKLPEAIQPAATRHVQALIDKEGDQAATVRQIAVMSSQLRKFLNPDQWLPAPGEVLRPSTRNNLRLVRHLLQTADLEAHGEAIVGLRDLGDYEHTNITGKDPTKLEDWHVERVITALTGNAQQIERAWLLAATSEGWTCEQCHLHGVTPPARNGFEEICPLQREDAQPRQTCRQFAARDEPLILPLHNSELRGWARTLEVEGIISEPFPHLTDYATWAGLVEQAMARRDAQRAAAEQKKETAHIVGIAEYWQLQQEGELFALGAHFPHFQGHYCHKCANYRHELRDRDLPPCRWVVEDLPSHWGSRRAPQFAAMIRVDGLLLPRCEQFRLDVPLRVHPMPGFVMPDRGACIDWLHRMLVGGNRATKDGALVAPLWWLPYQRPVGKNHDLDGLLRYVKSIWDDLGDEAIATLFTVAGSEAAAQQLYRGALRLVDPTTGELEEWQSIAWRELTARQKPYDYPGDWPTPWVAEETS